MKFVRSNHCLSFQQTVRDADTQCNSRADTERPSAQRIMPNTYIDNRDKLHFAGGERSRICGLRVIAIVIVRYETSHFTPFVSHSTKPKHERDERRQSTHQTPTYSAR